jgi:CheY-like chemotaxis protein
MERKHARHRQAKTSHHLLAAEDSEKGCNLALSEHPDVIMMDLEMPFIDRWEPVRTLKNDPQTRTGYKH